MRSLGPFHSVGAITASRGVLLSVIGMCAVTIAGCHEQEATVEVEANPVVRAAHVMRVSLTQDSATDDLHLKFNGNHVSTKVDHWPPALPIPESKHDLVFAFRASDGVPVGKAQPLLRQLALHERTVRLILVEQTGARTLNWHWSKDVDLLVPPRVSSHNDLQLPNIKVHLVAQQEGPFHIQFGGRDLGDVPAAYEALNTEIAKLVNGGKDPMTREIGVELTADSNAPWSHIRFTLLACSGRKAGNGNGLIRYIERFSIRDINTQQVFEEAGVTNSDSVLLFDPRRDTSANVEQAQPANLSPSPTE